MWISLIKKSHYIEHYLWLLSVFIQFNYVLVRQNEISLMFSFLMMMTTKKVEVMVKKSTSHMKNMKKKKENEMCLMETRSQMQRTTKKKKKKNENGFCAFFSCSFSPSFCFSSSLLSVRFQRPSLRSLCCHCYYPRLLSGPLASGTL